MDRNLIKEDLKKLFLSHKENIGNYNSSKDRILIYENIVKDITSTQYAFIILINMDNSFYIPTIDKTLIIDSNIDGGIIVECYETKEQHLVHNVRRSFLYRSYLDSFIDIKLQDILTIPIINNNNMIGMIWVATEIGNNRSFNQKDIEYLNTLSHLIRTKISSEENNMLNILLVDDSPIILRFIEIILKSYDVKITTALNATDSIEIFKLDKSIDIIFIDERMEALKGHQAIEIIRKIEIEESRDPIPIFGITSDTTLEVKERLLKAGASLVLHKPIDASEIIDAIKKFGILNKKRR
jgi:CheY-like chemotaxis protein